MAADTLNALAPVVEEPAKLNFFEMCLKGGWIMIPLVLMLVLAIYIFIERMIVTHQASKEDVSFMDRIKDYIYEGKLDAALKLCRDTKSPSARMIEKGISRLGRPMSDVLVHIRPLHSQKLSSSTMSQLLTMLSSRIVPRLRQL